MTQDEIIEMARQAGWSGIYSSWTSPTNRTSLTVPVTMQQIEAFAKLVAAKEREACAKVCETHGVHPALNVWNGGPDWYKHGKNCAAAIRARGEQA